ncbi:MAG: pyruvate kinase [Thermoflexales bacterium]|nr:pyruvate kinase [Thermoflexales bacterium]
MSLTKIVCTLGPATDAPEVLAAMMRAGMNVARINFSHGTHAEHARRIALVRQVADQEGIILAIMGDLQGPKLRVGDIAGGGVDLEPGSHLILTTRQVPGDSQAVHLPHPELAYDLEVGQRLLLDDGQLELRVESKDGADLNCRVLIGGRLGSHKGISVPDTALSLSSLTEKDRVDVRFAVEQAVDYLALSFVRSAQDVLELRALLRPLLDELQADIPVVAKIEKRQALEDFDDILAASDAIMVARGDLGVETPPEELPIHQKRIIKACNDAGKPVITATQMLQSMIDYPRPTRAEASDVANAILDGTDAVMLSGETAVGKYPLEAVRMMARIAANTEAHLACRVHSARLEKATDPTEAIAQATVEIAVELGAKVIVTSTMSGYSARMVARYRPGPPVLATTPDPAVQRRMALVWGVRPWLVSEYGTTDEMIEKAVRAVKQAGLAAEGDVIVLTAGIPVGGSGLTNFLKIHIVD